MTALPRIPDISGARSTEALDAHAERLIDRADKVFLAGDATEEQYAVWNRTLTAWWQASENLTTRRRCGSSQRQADRIDGYDRDDLGESPDF